MLLCLVVAAALSYQLDAPGAPGFDQASLERISAFLDKTVADGDLPFVDAMLVKDGKLVWQHRSGQGLEDDSLLEMYSATKLIGALAVMIAYDRGLLDLDDPLEQYIPEFANARVWVSGEGDHMALRNATVRPTIRHTLTHTSGILGYGHGLLLSGEMHPTEKRKAAHGVLAAGAFKEIDPFMERFPSLEEYAAAEAAEPLAFEPGTKYAYSHAQVHSARAVEVVSGMSFGEFVQREIFDPLEMRTAGARIMMHADIHPAAATRPPPALLPTTPTL
jgi:CubicO group peptidase (beta-lactamase class C family)